MKTLIKILVLISICCSLSACGNSEPPPEKTPTPVEQEVKTYTTEVVDGVTLVYNERPRWEENPEISLSFVRKLGDIEGDDENYALFYPEDVAEDKDGNLYVVDNGNTRIQKFSRDGTYLATIGRKGQGPGEFSNILAMDFDYDGNMFVGDTDSRKVLVLDPTGEEMRRFTVKSLVGDLETTASGGIIKRGFIFDSDKLIDVCDSSGEVINRFSSRTDESDMNTDMTFNEIRFATDPSDNVYTTYLTRNRIEKYSLDGTLLLRIDRPINYDISTEFKQEKKIIGGQSFNFRKVNYVSSDIAIDSKNRIWTLAFDRQLKDSELSLTSMVGVSSRDGGQFSTVQKKVHTNLEDTQMDAFVLEVFDTEGALLCKLPVNVYCSKLEIFGNRLYLIDPRHDMCVYVYEIVER
ncbi:MAG: 6-bladed beta-propeller [bacterium]|nr:6-bladed beta-propeller [bacterium]